MTTAVEDHTIDCFASNKLTVPETLRILTDDEINTIDSEETGCFRMMSQKDGDKRVVWCRRIIAQVQAAKEMFINLVQQGMIPYKVGINGQASSEVMRKFDPLAEEVIFMPVRAIGGG